MRCARCTCAAMCCVLCEVCRRQFVSSCSAMSHGSCPPPPLCPDRRSFPYGPPLRPLDPPPPPTPTACVHSYLNIFLRCHGVCWGGR
jgi:hypothetical protein